jgi:hypothetical protein
VQEVKVILAVAAALAVGSSPAAQVAATVGAEVRAFNGRQWQALWKLHTPRYRSTCSYAKFVAAEKRVRSRGGTLSATRIHVRVVSPKRALAYYFLVTQSHQTIRQVGDVYGKVGSRWLDELNRPGRAGCGY